MKPVTKAVIPAAGLGTRVLPATKAMPKGMLPIVDKPAIQYLVEEAVRSGVTDILIILGRNQSIIEDHFDRCPELEEKLAAMEPPPARKSCWRNVWGSPTWPTSTLSARSRPWAWATRSAPQRPLPGTIPSW